MSAFKDAIANDIDKTFFNLDEFSDVHKYEGQSIKCLVDDDRLDTASGSFANGGVFEHLTELYVSEEAIGAPVKGQSVTLDGVKYVVRSVSIEYGVIRIVLADEEQ
ncbi:MAG: hypothetical protein SPL83_10330 [Succinivibrio sp.]|jgi:hypothetical protein|uniref:hypothetical protein n=1 Tax=Succinivibrio sp. TaxID=2053619 RepID=UPI00206911FB|nr:hypothetical protein [Succinivibrio sp.]MCI7252161.1 hypothetical protein [Succinatimonas sp.]MDY6247619.1 hypothetical protein [Succinivibrio sp.]DAW54418.1 MAG TPA: ATP-binding sugar transporter [Caudoviricetes sp.]